MIRHVAVFAGAAALLVGSVPAARSQTRPDFTGTWVVESVDSPRPQNDGLRGGGGRGGGRAGIGGGGRGMPGGRARGGAGRGSQGAGPVRGGMVAEPFQKGDRVSITQTLDTLVVVQEASGSRTSYSFDGRETSNAGASGATVKSTTRWEGVALVTESSQSIVDAPRRKDALLDSKGRRYCKYRRTALYDAVARGLEHLADGGSHYLATTLNFLLPSSSAPRETVTVTFQVPPIDSWPGPRYCPEPWCASVAVLRIAGMFIEGIAGIENTVVTVASLTGVPSGCLTVTSNVLLPASGGSGSLRNSMARFWVGAA